MSLLGRLVVDLIDLSMTHTTVAILVLDSNTYSSGALMERFGVKLSWLKDRIMTVISGRE
jgi:hypothetical protein